MPGNARRVEDVFSEPGYLQPFQLRVFINVDKAEGEIFNMERSDSASSCYRLSLSEDFRT